MFGPMLTGRSAMTAAGTHQGIIPRVLTYLWSQCNTNKTIVDKTKLLSKKTITSASFKCSFYEIYQERIYDLLDSSSVTTTTTSSSGLSVREDIHKGIFVEGCTEKEIQSVEDAQELLLAGYRKRHTGDTAMNRESSRSHAVFQIYMTITTTTTTSKINQEVDNSTVTSQSVHSCELKDETNTTPESSLTTSQASSTEQTRTRVVTSRFSMVDLAGSERVRDTEAGGGRLKEANVINKSLTALGKVINELSNSQSIVSSSTPTPSKKKRHVSYRDSKLTFLLKDSLGGTAKTVLLATVSASNANFTESLSTLQFALRARGICNSFVRNEIDFGNDNAALQAEVKYLRAKLARYSSLPNPKSPAFTQKKRSSLVLMTETTPRNKRKSVTSTSTSFNHKGSLKSPTPKCNLLTSSDVIVASMSNAAPATQSTSPLVMKMPLSPLNNDFDKENSENSPMKNCSPLSPKLVNNGHNQRYKQLFSEHEQLKQLHRELEDSLSTKETELEEQRNRLREEKEAHEKNSI